MREYKVFLEAQELREERGKDDAEDQQATCVAGISAQAVVNVNRRVQEDVRDDNGDGDDNGHGDCGDVGTIVAAGPDVHAANAAKRRLSDGNLALNTSVFEARNKKVGCSKCRYKGCTKCRGYTLAQLQAYQASLAVRVELGQESDDDIVSPMGLRKRNRAAVSCDDASLGADAEESGDELGAERGLSSKKTRWAMEALSGLRAKVLSVVSKPIEALSSLSFWGRAGEGSEEASDEESDMSELCQTSEGLQMEAVVADVNSCRTRTGSTASRGEICVDLKQQQAALPFPHLLARPNRVPPPRGPRRQLKQLSGQLVDRPTVHLPFPHLLARPNRVAPPRTRTTPARNICEVENKENVAPIGMEHDAEPPSANPVCSKRHGTVRMVKYSGKKKSAKASNAAELKNMYSRAPSARTPPSDIRTLKSAAGTPSTARKTPARSARAQMVSTKRNTNTRSTRLSASKMGKRSSVRKASKKLPTTPKAPAINPENRDSIFNTPITIGRDTCDAPPGTDAERNLGPALGKETMTAMGGVSLLEKLAGQVADDNGLADDTKGVTQQNADTGNFVDGAGVNVDLHVVAVPDGMNDHEENDNDNAEQHSTPTPEVSFSFADMAGASKDTISADQLQQFSQEEQGPDHALETDLSPLRLPGATESDADFAFAEALQAFNSPEHDHRAVSRAMNVVGNLMSDLDASPDAKADPGSDRRLVRTPGKRRARSSSGVSGHPALSPSFDLVDPNADSPALSPVTFVLPDGANNGSYSRGRSLMETPGKHRAGEKANDSHHISSLAAEQGSFESAKQLLKKKMVLKQASQDALYMKVREVIINRHLAEIHRQGHDWANLDACGVPLDPSADHAGIEAKVLGSVRKQYGDDILQKLIAQVDGEWKRMCEVRQKYSKDAKNAARVAQEATAGGNVGLAGARNVGNALGKTTPTRSILRQQRSSDRLKGSRTLRWASESVQHTYTLNAPQEAEDAVRPPSSTRGLRMLGLASASPKGHSGRVSPLPASPTGMAAATAATATTPGGSGSGGNHGPSRRRSRTQNIQNTGSRSSQGHRLFQALQNASCPDSQPSSTPRTLSMIFEGLPDDDIDHSNVSSGGGGPTTSDTTTSSNGSRGSGGGGRWEQAEVECLIRAFKEWARTTASGTDRNSGYVWKFIGDKYRGDGLSDCRTNDDLKSKWKAMRKTAGKNRPFRYVRLTEDELEFLRSEASKP